MSVVAVGTHKAQVYDYTTKTVTGDKVIVEIMFKDLETKSLVKWTGWTHTPKTLKYTLKTLDLLGLKAGDMEKLADGRDSGALDLEKIVEVVVVEQKDNAQYTQVSFVNSLERKPAKAIFDKAASQGTKAKLSGLNAKLASMQSQKSTGTDW